MFACKQACGGSIRGSGAHSCVCALEGPRDFGDPELERCTCVPLRDGARQGHGDRRVVTRFLTGTGRVVDPPVIDRSAGGAGSVDRCAHVTSLDSFEMGGVPALGARDVRPPGPRGDRASARRRPQSAPSCFWSWSLTSSSRRLYPMTSCHMQSWAMAEPDCWRRVLASTLEVPMPFMIE